MLAFKIIACRKSVLSRLLPILVTVVTIFCGCAPRSDRNPLLDSARKGDTGSTAKALTEGVSIESKDERGRTPLYIAALGGKKELVEYLLNNGADPNKGAAWKVNRTPLHAAAMYGYADIIRLLLSSGAIINKGDDVKDTALHLASWYGRTDAVATLLEHGADPNARDKYGYTPLHFRFKPEDATMLARPTDFAVVAKLLLQRHANVNAIANDGWTPLMAACDVAPLGVVEILLANGANPDAIKGGEITALSVAKARKREDVVQLLARKR